MIILQLLSIGAALLLGAVVVTRNPADRNRWLLLLFNSSVSLWIASYILADQPGSASLAWNKLVFITALLMGYVGYVLIASMANRLGRAAIVTGTLLAAWFGVVLLTPLIVQDITPRLAADGALVGFDIVRGQGYFLYVVSLLVTGGGLIGFIFRLSRKARGRFKSQLRIILGGFMGLLIVGLAIGVILPIVLQSSAPANLSFLSAFVIIGAFTYSIVQQRLFDIRLALVRSLGYVAALIALTAFYGLAIFGIADLLFRGADTDGSLRVYYVVAALVTAITFQPLKQFLTRITRRLFFRDTYDTEEVFGRLTTFLVGTVDLTVLREHSAGILKDALKVEALEIVVAKSSSRYDVLLRSLATNTEWPVITDELKNSRVGTLADKLYEQKVALVSRLETPQGVVGYIICGQKLRGDVLTTQDIELMRIASNELAVALQNASRFAEIERFNVTLKEQIDDATHQLRDSNRKLHKLDEAKDEFISMASHQLRTPLTSVKGYVSMVLEGDAGKISNDQRKLLEEAYGSAQRMVYLIGDFLNVSRIQTGKFMLEAAPVNLAAMVKDEVSQLQATAQRRDINLEYHAPSQFPDILMDEGKMRQVVMNFIDNAIFYSKPNSTVMIELTLNARDATLAVHDTGIGVPAGERHHLFTKFYRATNARQVRPDGTGIGLYMAKKVVTSHGGSILFETKENRGSTFGFTIPLKHHVK